MEKNGNYSLLWKRTFETQEKMSKNENAVAILLLNVYLCNLAVPCGILSALRIFHLLLYLEKKKTVVLLLLFSKGKRLDAILAVSSAPVQMPSI